MIILTHISRLLTFQSRNHCRKPTPNYKRTQTELVQASKLATLGTMSAGIAHELSNPLAAVKGFCQILHAKNKQGELDNIFVKTLKAIR